MISEPRFWDGPSRDFGPNKILSTNLVERSSMPKQDFYLFNIIAWYGNCLMNMVLFYKMTFSYMILFKHKFLKNFYPIFIMKGEHQAKLSWWIELIICQHSNILCSRFYLNQITHNCQFLFTIFLGRTFLPLVPTYQPKLCFATKNASKNLQTLRPEHPFIRLQLWSNIKRTFNLQVLQILMLTKTTSTHFLTCLGLI